MLRHLPHTEAPCQYGSTLLTWQVAMLLHLHGVRYVAVRDGGEALIYIYMYICI